jgi:hypothetical protein
MQWAGTTGIGGVGVHAFSEMIRAAAPEMYTFLESTCERHSLDRMDAMKSIYKEMTPADFSRIVSSGPKADRLDVFSLGDVGWTYWGDPRRVMTVLAQTAVQERWSAFSPPIAGPEAS